MPLLIGKAGKQQAKQAAKALLEKVGLASRFTHRPAELSGGERQRVAIARSLANNPSCVLMDEPTGNLDRGNAQAIQNLMLELSRESSTSFIVVTHDSSVAESMDSIYELSNGKLHKQ